MCITIQKFGVSDFFFYVFEKSYMFTKVEFIW